MIYFNQQDINIDNLKIDMYTAASLGLIKNAVAVHKFGLATDLDTADGQGTIWDGSFATLPGGKIAEYTYSTTANIDTIISTDDTDAEEITIEGLDTNWELTVQTVTLTGQTPKLITTPLVRVFRMFNSDSVETAGFVFLTINGADFTTGIPDLETDVRSIINPANQQTQMGLYAVPANYKLVLTHGWASLAGKNINVNAALIIKARIFGGVFRTLHTTALLSAGNSLNDRPYETPVVFNEKEDLLYTAEVDSNDTAVSAGFHGVLIPTSIFY